MSKAVFVLDPSGVRELLKSAEVKAECRRQAEPVYEAVSKVPGYHMEERSYPERNGYAIFASEYPAISDNLKHNTLVKAAKI